MSAASDAILRALEDSRPTNVNRAALGAVAEMRSEIERLRDALGGIDFYIKDLAYPGPETNWIADLVREALAGDAE